MSKFKVGDQVRVVNHPGYDPEVVGEVVENVCWFEPGDPNHHENTVVFSENGGNHCFKDDDLVLVSDFKVGDKVLVKPTNDHGWGNRKGEIIDRGVANYDWKVKFDYGNGSAVAGAPIVNTVSFNEDELELIEADPEVRFKAGDLVTVVADNWGGHGDTVGKTGTVIDVNPEAADDFFYTIKLPGYAGIFEARDDELELAVEDGVVNEPVGEVGAEEFLEAAETVPVEDPDVDSWQARETRIEALKRAVEFWGQGYLVDAPDLVKIAQVFEDYLAGDK